MRERPGEVRILTDENSPMHPYSLQRPGYPLAICLIADIAILKNGLPPLHSMQVDIPAQSLIPRGLRITKLLMG